MTPIDIIIRAILEDKGFQAAVQRLEKLYLDQLARERSAK